MIELVPYGAQARRALGERIATLKAGDPLAPVTVIVPTNYAGLSARRDLAAREPLVNVRFTVAARLAELLGGPALAARGERPLTPWIRLQAVRTALAEAPGVFAEVATHPSTARELGRVFAELREATAEARAALTSSSRRAADVIRLYERFLELTDGFYDEVGLMESAARLLERGGGAGETGPIVLYLPRKVSRTLARLVAPPGTEAHAILGLTGDDEVDAATETMATSLGDSEVRRVECAVPAGTRVVSATEPEEEVREAVRQAMALARAGTPLHRIAFVYESRDIYAGLLDDALSSAQVPHNGPSTRTLAQTIAGRTILGLPRIAASSGADDPGYARDVVMDWLTGAPIWHQGREAPSHRWDDISRDAGIVRGPAQWRDRLDYYAAAQELEASQREAGEGTAFEARARWARNLADFMQGLREKLGEDERLPASEHAARALGWLDAYLPSGSLADEEEVQARERVKRLLEEVAVGGRELPAGLDPRVSRQEFSAALEEALSEPAGRTGTLGEGVFCGPVTVAGEMQFDTVLVLGMVEGAFPALTRDDPLLTTSERARTKGELPPGGRLPTESRRAYLAALHAAPVRILSVPRGDLRSQRGTQPSRWLLESAGALAGEKIYATELSKLLEAPPEWFRVVHSFEAALRTATEPASPQEWDLASLLRYRGRLKSHFLLRREPGNPLGRGVEAIESRSRRAGRLDGWMGRVAPGAAPAPGRGRPISPTALEQFAACPFRYFLGQVLHVGEMEKPEELVTIAPATIGIVVHEILQGFFEKTAVRDDPFAEWTEEERRLLRELAAQSFATAERSGQTGKDLTWQAEQARILRDLELLLDRELRERRLEGFRFRAAEVAFGLDPHRAGGTSLPAAVLSLADGTEVAFRGKVDRVDEGPNGELLITDYKTGSTRKYKELEPKNPLQGGKFLQLPIYALAFKEQSAAPVRARYWFISEQADFVMKEVVLDESTNRTFSQVVETLAATMREGYFPAVPGNDTYRPGRDSWDNCVYCPYDLLCPGAQRTETWEDVKREPGIIPFATLAESAVALEEATDE